MPPAVPLPPPRMSITQRYDDEQVFRTVLGNIGVPAPVQNIITGDGINKLSTLVELYKEDVDSFEVYLKGINKTYSNTNPPIRISPLVIGRLIGVLFVYAVSVEILHHIPDPINITLQMAQDYGNHYKRYKSYKSSDNDDDEVKLPKLDGHKNWITFRDQFENKLSGIHGSKYLTLSYVIDRTERRVTSIRSPRIEVPTVDVSDLSNLKPFAVHFGPTYKRDNAMVWSVIKTALLSTQPYNIIDTCDNTKDGRKAFEMLRSYYKGEDFVEATVQENLARIRSLFYHGETPKFNFDKFVHTQMECYKRLRDVGYNNGRGVDDTTMCTDLISSIMPAADLEVALSLARNKGITNSDYERLVQFFKAEIDNRNRRNRMWGRGRGKQVGALGMSGDKSHGRARGRGKNKGKFKTGKDRLVLTKMVDGKEVKSSSYSADEFRKLSKTQRDAVKELRAKVKQKRSAEGNTQQTNVSAVSNTDSMESRMRQLEMAIVAGVANASGASTDTIDGASTITDDIQTTGTNGANSGAVGSYLRQRRNNQSGNSSSR